MTIKQIQDNIIERFSIFDNWMDKYKELIDIANENKGMPAELKTEKNRVIGCQSLVWIHIEKQDGILYIQGDSDSVIVKGLVTMVVSIYNKQSIKNIINEKLYFIESIGLKEQLTPNRSNGLLNMIQVIQNFAKRKE